MNGHRHIIATGVYVSSMLSFLYLMGQDRYNVMTYTREPKYTVNRIGIYRYFHMSGDENGGQDVTYRGLRHMEVRIRLPRPVDLAVERFYIPDEIRVEI